MANDIDRPKNDAIIAGRDTQITCRYGTAATVSWFHTSPNDNAEKLLYNGKIMLDSFSNTNESGRVRGQSLNINPVKLENSGSFKCVTGGMELIAQLIVLGGSFLYNINLFLLF